MNEPKKAEKGRCSICGKYAVIENGVCNLPVCQRRIEEGRLQEQLDQSVKLAREYAGRGMSNERA